MELIGIHSQLIKPGNYDRKERMGQNIKFKKK